MLHSTIDEAYMRWFFEQLCQSPQPQQIIRRGCSAALLHEVGEGARFLQSHTAV